MAKKIRGIPFKKGDPNIPKSPGRPRENVDRKETRAVLKEISNNLSTEYAEIAQELLLADSKYVLEIEANKPNEKMLKVMLARILIRIANKGDSRALEPILARAIGPVRQQLDVTSDNKAINTPQADEVFAKIKADFLEVIKAEKEWVSQTSLEQELPSSHQSSP